MNMMRTLWVLYSITSQKSRVDLLQTKTILIDCFTHSDSQRQICPSSWCPTTSCSAQSVTRSVFRLNYIFWTL